MVIPIYDIQILKIKNMHNRHFDFIALGGSLFITFAILGLFYSYILIQKDNEFDLIAKDLTSSIESRLVNYEQVLFATQGLFASSDQVTSEEWRTFVKNQQIETRFPGVQVTGYAQKIGTNADLPSHVEKMRSIWPNYSVFPDAPREQYYAVVYIEPVTLENSRAVGYDMFSEPVRRAAMEKACDTNIATITGKVILVQETGKDVQPGFLMYLPVYKNNMPHESVEEKQAALQGFVYVAFRTHDLFNAMLPSLGAVQHNDMRIKVYDSAKSEGNLLYDSKKNIPDDSWHKSTQINFGYQTWLVEFSRPHTFSDFETTVMVAVPAIGVSMSAFVFIAIRSNQRNIDRITRLNEDLVKSEKLSAVGQLASRLAHDIRNPISVIKNTVEIAKNNKTLDEKMISQLDRIERAASKINYQVSDTLDFVRTTQLQIKENSVKKILSLVADRIDKPSAVTINLPENDHTIKCDAEKLEVAIANLVTNSIQAMDGEGTINIRVNDQDKFHTIEVEDSGPGIPENIMPKIFEPLFTTKPKGTGLGLATVKNIIEQHGGTIYVKNNPTIFTISLPK
jgi:signal transduction histidine kinase